MLKQLIDVKSNKIFVLQTAGIGTSCPACVWQTDLHTGTAAVCEPVLSLLHTTAAIYLYACLRNTPTLPISIHYSSWYTASEIHPHTQASVYYSS